MANVARTTTLLVLFILDIWDRFCNEWHRNGNTKCDSTHLLSSLSALSKLEPMLIASRIDKRTALNRNNDSNAIHSIVEITHRARPFEHAQLRIPWLSAILEALLVDEKKGR